MRNPPDPTQPANATLVAMASAEIEVYGRCTPTICKRLVAALTPAEDGFVTVPLAHMMVVTEIANRNEQSSSGDIMRDLLATRLRS